MSDPTLRERVARALCAHGRWGNSARAVDDEEWAHLPQWRKDGHLAKAEAALAAIKEAGYVIGKRGELIVCNPPWTE